MSLHSPTGTAGKDLGWIALAETEQLPIRREPVLAAAAGVANVKAVSVPYKPLDTNELTEVAERLGGASAILLRSGYVTEELLDRLPDLRVVAVHGTGVDPVDIDACTRRGVRVTNTPGANAAAVAELCIGLMVSALRGIATSSNDVRQDHSWDAARVLGGELGGRCLGLLGLGQIGRRVAKIAGAMDMRVIACDPGVEPQSATQLGAELVSLDSLLEQSQILSLHAPAIPATRHIINADALRRLPAGALLINCARGALVDETALADALQSGHLSGAALDVLDGEPPDPHSPIFAAPNVLITPHMAGSTEECLQRIAHVAAQDIIRVLGGEEPAHPVN